MKTKGRITLPGEKGLEHLLADIAEKWGADAVRNSDGTELPTNLDELGLEVYSTLSLTRSDQDYARENEDQLTQKFLMSNFFTAFSDTLEIDIMKDHFDQQFRPDDTHDVKKYFEVYDRTTGELVSPEQWDYDKERKKVIVKNAKKYHVYTCNFLVYQIWDSTSMYNYITNNWTGEHVRPLDPRQPKTREHLKKYLSEWLDKNPDTDVVRLTSLMYHFTNNYMEINGEKRQRYGDWTGYHDATSVLALEEFKKEYGYELKPEDFTTEGYMCNMRRVPSKKYLDWMDFVQRTVTSITKEWVDIIHEKGRKAMMFYCDHWIGSEPYGKYFSDMGLDAIVGPCLNGVQLRRVADVPADVEKEVRLYPYFFPVNLEGKPNFPDGDPVGDCKKYWKQIRRAMVQNPADRIGFGGYLSLAVTRPDFIDYVAVLADEFREIHSVLSKYKGQKASFKVGVLTSWGKIRAWMDDEVLEALSGLNFDIEFMSFDDIVNNGIPEDVKVIINSGDAYTSWSGGEHWKNEKVQTTIREWVAEKGGGFIGIGEPSAYQFQGHFFQLFDVLGVDRDMGYGISSPKLPFKADDNHFILEDGVPVDQFKNRKNGIYKVSMDTNVLLSDGNNILMATHTYGKGRSVYMTGYYYFDANVRLLLRAIYWAAGKEAEMKKWFSSNYMVECTAFPEAGKLIVLNNSFEAAKTTLYNDTGKTVEIETEPFMSKWFDIDELFK